jgi:hypothetical protein
MGGAAGGRVRKGVPGAGATGFWFALGNTGIGRGLEGFPVLFRRSVGKLRN